MTDNMTDDGLYEMTREFLIETTKRSPARPQRVARVLENLGAVAPEHARILEQYIRDLEKGAR